MTAKNPTKLTGIPEVNELLAGLTPQQRKEYERALGTVAQEFAAALAKQRGQAILTKDANRTRAALVLDRQEVAEELLPQLLDKANTTMSRLYARHRMYEDNWDDPAWKLLVSNNMAIVARMAYAILGVPEGSLTEMVDPAASAFMQLTGPSELFARQRRLPNDQHGQQFDHLCPKCGGPNERRTRKCQYCGNELL